MKLLSYPVPYGALTQLYAGTMPEGANLNGKVCLSSCTFSFAVYDIIDKECSISYLGPSLGVLHLSLRIGSLGGNCGSGWRERL